MMFICLTETNCDSIDVDIISGLQMYYNVKKKKKNHRYGGIHGICILLKEHIAIHCPQYRYFSHQNPYYGLYINKNVLGIDCIIGCSIYTV